MTRAAVPTFPSPVLRWRATAFALILYSAFLIGIAPASVLGWIVAIGTDGALTIERPRGRLWQGSADALAFRDESGRFHRYEGVRWAIAMSRLWRGGLSANIYVDDPNVRGSTQLDLGPHRARLSETAFESPARVLANHHAVLARRNLTGDLELRSASFLLDRGTFSGEATLAWRRAGSASGTFISTSDYVAQIAGSGERIEFQIATVDGPLHIDGKGTWSRKTGLSFEGTARVAAADQHAFADILNLLGPDSGGGIHRISLGVASER